MSSIKRISADHLQVGMYIADLNNAWIPDNNLRRHGLIKRSVAIEQIRKLGVTELYIDTAKGLDCSEGTPIDTVNEKIDAQLSAIQRNAPDNKPVVEFSDELSSATSIHANALNLVSQVMHDVKMGNVVNLQPVEDMADSISESIRRNQSALSCFTRLRCKDQYLMEHSFSVAVLMGVLARAMGFSGDEMHELVTGGLLHDVGKVHVPDEILNKPGSLTPDEWEEMKRHVQYGEEALNQPEVPTVIKQICAQHHERLDGTGYPRGLSKDAVVMAARMGAVVDVYDAITADRVYHQGMLPTAAMKKILDWSGSHLDSEVVYQFIACMSIYPAGSVVELASNRLAMVVEPNLRQQHKPLVSLMWDTVANSSLPPKLLNLALSDIGDSIKRAVSPDEFCVSIAGSIMRS
ncbi:HD-GYP domain-containing protein [Aurantivibrio plasticivorans]